MSKLNKGSIALLIENILLFFLFLGIQEYMEYVGSLTFDECPSYEKCRMILREGLTRRGYSDDGKLVFLSATPKAPSKKVRKSASCSRDDTQPLPSPSSSSPKKRKKCAAVNGAHSKASKKALVSRSRPSSLSREKVPRDKGKPTVRGSSVKSSSINSRRISLKKKTAKASQRRGSASSIFDNPTPAMLAILNKRKA